MSAVLPDKRFAVDISEADYERIGYMLDMLQMTRREAMGILADTLEARALQKAATQIGTERIIRAARDLRN